MRKRDIILIGLLLCCITSISAQEMLTLEQCKKLAVENNVKMRNARLEQSASSEVKKEAFTKYFPVVSAMGTGIDANKGMMEMNIMGMGLPLMKNGVVGAITAIQPVFTGGRIIYGNKLAKLGEEVSSYQLQLSEDEVTFNAEQYFWQIVSLQEKMKTVQVVETQLSNLHKDVSVSFDAGIITRNDVLRVELKQNEIASNKLSLENGISIARLALNQYLGTPNKEYLLDTIPFTVISSPLEFRMNHEEALQKRAEYRLLGKKVEASRVQTKMKTGEYMPQVAVGAGYVYHDLLDNKHNFAMAFATVSVPLSGWWGGSHAIKKLKLNQQMAENTKQSNSELLLIQMQQLWNELEEAYKQVKLAEKSVQSSTENLRLNNEYYKAGTVALSDLLDAQTLMQQSRNQETEAKVNFLIKKSRYLQVTGR